MGLFYFTVYFHSLKYSEISFWITSEREKALRHVRVAAAALKATRRHTYEYVVVASVTAAPRRRPAFDQTEIASITPT